MLKEASFEQVYIVCGYTEVNRRSCRNSDAEFQLGTMLGNPVSGLYPKICVNHKRALSEICKLWVHFDAFRD